MTRRNSFYAVVLAIALIDAATVYAQKQRDSIVKPDQQRMELIKKWRNMGFGMFIHWGAYTQLAGKWKGLEKSKDLWGEWIMKRAKISIPEYEKAIKPFNPSEFNAHDWVKLAKDAGMKYMIITAKHHDGFAMYPSKATKYNIKDHCGFQRDPMKELSEECAKQGVGFGFYYSHRIDWHEPGASGYKGKEKGSLDDYWNNKVYPQVQELTTNYGPLTVMWFDMGCKYADKVKKLREMVLKNQPNCVINSRIGSDMGDYKSQKDCYVPAVPDQNPWETHMTTNQHWAWYPQDVYFKGPEDIVRLLIAVRSMGGNFLLNVGPDRSGRIPFIEVITLEQVGEWMKKFGEAIYGVEPSPLPAFPWGRCTRKGDLLYLHVFKWSSNGTLFVPGITSEVEKAYPLAAPDSDAVSVHKVPYGVELKLDPEKLPVEALSKYATVLVLKTVSPLKTDKQVVLDHYFDNEFSVTTATLTPLQKLKPKKYSMVDTDPAMQSKEFRTTATADSKTSMSWKFANAEKELFRVIVKYTVPSKKRGSLPEITVQCGGQEVTAALQATADYPGAEFRKLLIGSLTIPEGKEHTMVLKVSGADDMMIPHIEKVILMPCHIKE